MSNAPAAREAAGTSPAPVRRVRHQARDAVAVMAFSAVTATALSLGLVLATSLGH